MIQLDVAQIPGLPGDAWSETHVFLLTAGVMIALMPKALGSTHQDKLGGDRPEYQALTARTRQFLPLPIREGATR